MSQQIIIDYKRLELTANENHKHYGWEWTLPINDIKIIGEWSDGAGPFADDWFLTFITGTQEEYTVSCDAIGINEVKEWLSGLLGSLFCNYIPRQQLIAE